MNEVIEMLLIIPGILAVIGALGIVRFKDFFSRIHAATIISVGGVYLAMLILTGGTWISEYSMKILVALFVLLIADPTATHAIAEKSLELDKPHGSMQRNDLGTDMGRDSQ